MAWGDLASNQMVTFTDAQTSSFVLNSGQSPVTSNECMTKSQALTKYNIDASAMSAYASNQLVPKSVWSNGFYIINDTNGYAINCSIELSNGGTLYTTNSNGIINIGDILYVEDAGPNVSGAGTTSYNAINEGGVRKIITTNTSGVVITKANCI